MQGNSRDYYTCKPPSNMFVLLEIRPHCPFYSVKPSSPSPPPCIFTPLPETSVITTAGCTLACVFRWFLYKQTPPPPLDTRIYIIFLYSFPFLGKVLEYLLPQPLFIIILFLEVSKKHVVCLNALHGSEGRGNLRLQWTSMRLK